MFASVCIPYVKLQQYKVMSLKERKLEKAKHYESTKQQT